MVTLQEVEQREEELKILEQQANAISNIQIPQRRYGSRVTKDTQKQYYSSREQAKGVLVQIGEQRTQLTEARAIIKENELIQAENDRRQAEYDAKLKEYNDYQRGYRIGIKGNAPGYVGAYLNKNEKKGYKDALAQIDYSKAKAQYQKQLSDLKAQGLKPVYVGGKITGFEDLEKQMSIPLKNVPQFLQQNPSEIKRYELAKVIEIQKTNPNNLPTSNKEDLLRMLVKPSLSERTIGSFRPEGSSSNIPIKNVFYQDIALKPFGIRVATQEEKDYFYSQRQVQAQVNPNIIYPTKTGAKINKAVEQLRYNFNENFPRTSEVLGEIGTRITPIDIVSLSFPASKVPMKIVTPLRELSEFSVSPESVVRVSAKGKEVRLSAFEIYTEIKPPRIELKRVKGQGFLDAIEIEKPSLYVRTKPSEIVKGENPYLALSSKNLKYSKVGSLGEVIPVETNFISLSEINSLPNVEKYLFQKLAELKTGGRPVSLKNVNKILSKDDLYIRGALEVRGKGKVRGLNKNSIEIEGLKGIKVKQYLTLSSAQKAGETKYLEIYDIKTIFKDVTKPFSRASGKTSVLKTKLFELKETIILDKAEVNFISPADIIKTPMSKTFSEQILKSIMAKAPPVKVPRLKLNSLSNLKQIQQENNIIGLGSLSRYAGKGQYERTDGGILPGERSISLEKMNTLSIKNIPLIKQEPLSKIGQKDKPLLMERSLSKNILLEKNILKETNILKDVSIEKEVLVQRQVQKQKQVQKEKLVFKPITKTPITNIPRINPPRVPGKKLPIFNFNVNNKSNGGRVTGYLPFVLKGGKKLYLGPPVPKGNALISAENVAKKTLRATFGAEKTGKKVKGINLNFSPNKNLFRSFRISKGKRVPLVDTFIQKLGKRLSFKGEVKELQSFRRRR